MFNHPFFHKFRFTPRRKQNRALWQAVQRCEVDAVQQALLDGANPNCNNGCYTALGEAGRHPRGTAEIVKLLLDAGADPNISSKAPWLLPPLVQASHQSDEERIRLVVEAGAELNLWSVGSPGSTPLQELITWAETPFIEWFIERGADIHLRGFDNRTALHMAAAVGRLDVVEMLLHQGANPDQPDDNGLTPLDWANRSLHPEVGSRPKGQHEKDLQQIVALLQPSTG